MPKANEPPGTLQRGDLLLTSGKFDTGVHAAINIGQAIFSHSTQGSYEFCHAAIHIGSNVVAEAVGEGIGQNKIPGGHTYVVFRYKDKGLANAVADTAERWSSPNANGETMKYAFTRLATSVFSFSALGPIGKAKIRNLASQIHKAGGPNDWWGKNRKAMICSEFAISCYDATSYSLNQSYAIKVDPTGCSPKELSNRLRKDPDWTEFTPLNWSVGG